MSNLSHAPLASLADAEGVLEFRSFSEMESRPSFCRHLDPGETKLVKIIGFYSFPDHVQCGLPDHTPHQTGYLVVTDDGRETNIGHVCGKKHFGEDFQILRNRFESRRRVKDYREQLGAFRSKLPTYHEQIDGMRKDQNGATWLNAICETFRRHCPIPLWDDLRRRARLEDGRVYELTVLRGAEAERRLAAEGKLRDDHRNEQGDGRKDKEAVDLHRNLTRVLH